MVETAWHKEEHSYLTTQGILAKLSLVLVGHFACSPPLVFQTGNLLGEGDKGFQSVLEIPMDVQYV